MEVHDDKPPRRSNSSSARPKHDVSIERAAIEFAQQAEKLSHLNPHNGSVDGVAVEAEFITNADTVIITADENRLPSVPVEQAHRLNALREELEANAASKNPTEPAHNPDHALNGNMP